MKNKDDKAIYDKLAHKKKFCLNCKFFQAARECHHEKNLNLDLVDGRLIFFGDAYSMRVEKGACGPDAKLFEKA